MFEYNPYRVDPEVLLSPTNLANTLLLFLFLAPLGSLNFVLLTVASFIE